jgi:hypothetical protein
MTPRRVRWDMIDHRANDESAEPIEKNEPTDRTDHAEPTEPIDMNEPTDPIESIEPFEPIERNESSDHSDHRDRDAVTGPVSHGRPRTKEGPPEFSGGPSPMRKAGLLSPRDH